MKYSEIEKVILHLSPIDLILFKKYNYLEWLKLNNTIINKEQYDRYILDLAKVHDLYDKEKNENKTNEI